MAGIRQLRAEVHVDKITKVMDILTCLSPEVLFAYPPPLPRPPSFERCGSS